MYVEVQEFGDRDSGRYMLVSFYTANGKLFGRNLHTEVAPDSWIVENCDAGC
jgi:hypothetical protein